MGENTEEKRNGKTKYKMKKNRRIKIERPEIEKNWNHNSFNSSNC